MAMSYSVKSWTLPKRFRGTWPANYVSMSVDASSAREAAERAIKPASVKRAIYVESFYGKRTVFTLSPDGKLTENKRKSDAHAPRRPRAYRGR